MRLGQNCDVAAAEPPAAGCSAKGCRARGEWVLAWNNPKLHPPERRKAWVACEQHREHLTQFLAARGLMRDVVALEEWSGEQLPGAAPSTADGGHRARRL